MRGLPPRLWRRVEEALEETIGRYERVNHLISLWQDERARRRGLRLIDSNVDIALELGSGPGNYARLLAERFEAPLLCLDYSPRMLIEARERLRELNAHLLRGVFEALPLRESTLSLVVAAYALRDSTDRVGSLKEVRRILKSRGRLLLIDLGRPRNPLMERLLALHLRIVVPLIAALAARRGLRNPWRMLYETYRMLPRNDEMLRLLKELLGDAEMEELALGAIIIAVAERSEEQCEG